MVSHDSAPVSADELEQAHDAARLAVRLRALALMLCLLLARGFAFSSVAGPQACRPCWKISGPAVRRLDAPAKPAPDTSLSEAPASGRHPLLIGDGFFSESGGHFCVAGNAPPRAYPC